MTKIKFLLLLPVFTILSLHASETEQTPSSINHTQSITKTESAQAVATLAVRIRDAQDSEAAKKMANECESPRSAVSLYDNLKRVRNPLRGPPGAEDYLLECDQEVYYKNRAKRYEINANYDAARQELEKKFPTIQFTPSN